MILFYFLLFILSVQSKTYYKPDFSLLINFTCAVAKDELEKHPEMRTIAMIELENNFPSDFSAKVLKCLPKDVAKVSLKSDFNFISHSLLGNNALKFPKDSMFIYIADKAEWHPNLMPEKLFTAQYEEYLPKTYLSKHLILSSSDKEKLDQNIFNNLLNVVQVYKQNQRVVARTFDATENLTTFQRFESLPQENISQTLFPDKISNLKGQKLFAAFMASPECYNKTGTLNCKWTHYLDIIADKLNATVKISEFEKLRYDGVELKKIKGHNITKAISEGKLDFFLNYENGIFDLKSYNDIDWCFLASSPKPISIADQILFLPMDKSCWMWLGITIAVSTLIWRISEGHWNFAFGAFAYFMGQAQLIIRIRTNRLTMKILLQILIITFFIFSNGYQSLVTSFMLNPLQLPLLKSVDEVLESDLIIDKNRVYDMIQSDNPKYQKAVHEGRVDYFEPTTKEWWLEVAQKNAAPIQECKMMKMRIEKFGNGKTWEGLYLIPEVAFSHPEDLYTRPMHPYIEIFQQIMDRSLEAGLHQAWEKKFWQIFGKNKKRKAAEEEKEILEFDDIAPFFLILAIGFVAGLLALICEIFHRDFVSELSREFLKRKFENPLKKRVKVQMTEVRRIQVEPAN